MINRYSWLILPVLLLALPATTASAEEESPVITVRNVDLDHYLGVWYEVAKIPNRFQKQCARGTTATYSLREDGRLTVLNECVESNGELSSAEGIARVVAGTGNSQLEVSFVSFLGWRPFWGDYWIVGLDANYQWAAVGSPDRKYGWILARAATPDAQTLDAAFGTLTQNGFQRDDFELSLP